LVWRTIGLRLLAIVPTLLVSSVVVFFTINIIPGHASSAFLGVYQTKQTTAAFNHRYGLDRPLVVQYGDWAWHAVRGDFGKSLLSEIPVGPQVLSRIPITLELALLALLVALAIGLPLGVVAATRHNRPTDTVLSMMGVGGMSVPNFLVATLLVLVFSLALKLVAPGGYVPITEDVLRNLQLMVLPAISLGIVSSTILFRIMRSSMIEVLEADYVRTALAKGVGYWVVIVRHALKNALVPFLTVAGIEFSALFGGAVIIEQIFLIPGLGSYVFDGIELRDYFVLQASVMVLTTMVVVANTLADVLVIVIDPRRAAGEA
jgi:peptide/nickel transport system permease protein